MSSRLDPHDVAPHRFQTGEPMLLAGLRRHHQAATAASSVAQQWHDFLASASVAGRIGTHYYGAMCGGDASGFEYLTGVEVEGFEHLPKDVGRMRVPAQQYAVFRHPTGQSLELTWRGIMAWLASGSHESAHQPDFERYDAAPAPGTPAPDMEVWVGVVERGGARSDMRNLFVAATPAQVFAAMSDPARIARWWGPNGFSNTIHRFDFQPGGSWLLTMRGPDGTDYPNESRFTRLVPGELFEIEHLSGHHFVLSIELHPSAGGTEIRWRQTFDTAEHYAPIASFIAEANQQNLERLRAEVLSSLGNT